MINQLAAFRDTLDFARTHGMNGQIGSGRGLDYNHLVDLFRKICDAPGAYDEAKIGRWLGWAQCAVVASGCGTLEDMKQINLRNKE